MPKITRRNFLKLGALGAAGGILAGCQQPRRWVILEPFVRPPEEQLAGVATWYASTCRQCPAGCGIIVRLMNGRALKIEGNPEHPLNQGKLCARGQAGLQLLYNPDRSAGPLKQTQRGSRQFQALSWEAALNTLYPKLQAAGSGVAVWVGSTTSGHLLDIFQKFTTAINAPAPVVFDQYSLMNGYPVYSSAGQTLFNSPDLPGYDIANADVVLSFGADILGTWLSAVHYGKEYGKFRSQALGKRGYLIQLEPKMSITGAKADQWLPIRPGTEALVAQAIARLIADQGQGPADRIARAKAVAGQVDVKSVASLSDIPVEQLARLARIFAKNDKVLAIPGGSATGQPEADKAVAAIQMLNVIAGNIGQPGGMTPPTNTSITGIVKTQPTPFTDVQGLIKQMSSGSIKVLLIHGANPAYDLPAQVGFKEALAKVPLVVSFSPIPDETAVLSDLVLPDRTYLEAWGYQQISPDFGNPVVSSQQPVVTPVFDVRSTGDVMLTLARAIPAAASVLPYADEVAYLKDVVGKLPAGANGGSGPDVLWARYLQHGGWWPSSSPAASASQAAPSQTVQISAPQYQGQASDYPYYLHLYVSNLLSDGRGASQPWLQGTPDPMTTVAWQTLVEINPATAQKLGLSDGDLVKVTSPNGEIQAPIYTFQAIRPDTIAIATGQGHTDYGRYAQNNGANPIQLLGSQAESSGNNLTWSNLRVKITPTGQKVSLALFEYKLGVTQGFINAAFPGQ